MKFKQLFAACMVLATLSLFSLPLHAAHVDVGIAVGGPVPPPLVASAGPIGPPPGPGYVWVDGYWDWFDGHWVWTPGRWVLPPHGHVAWVAPAVRVVHGHPLLYRGHWR